MKKTLLLTLALIVLSGCVSERIRPGHTQAATSDGAAASAVQSQDPNAPTTQDIETDTTMTRVLPAGSVVESGSVTNLSRTTLSAPSTESSTTHKIINTRIGSSQKNTAQDIAAKLASVRWLQWIGLLFVVFGGASLAWPPLQAIVNSVTTSVWCIVGGGAMIFLPIIIVGHEILILGVAGGVALLWFLAHRHGSVTAELSTLKSMFMSSSVKAPSVTTPTSSPTAPAASTPPATSAPANS